MKGKHLQKDLFLSNKGKIAVLDFRFTKIKLRDKWCEIAIGSNCLILVFITNKKSLKVKTYLKFKTYTSDFLKNKDFIKVL